MPLYYENVEVNVERILNRRENGVNTIIANAPCQSGKTDIAPCLQKHLDGPVAYVIIPSDNLLFEQNSSYIFNKNYIVYSEKMHNLLKDLEENKEIPYQKAWVFDEPHVGQKEASRFHKLLMLLNEYYKKQGWGKPFIILLGATNWQLMDAHNRDILHKDLFGRCEAIDLEVGDSYCGVEDILKNKNIIIKDPIDGVNKVKNNQLHPILLEELNRLCSKDLKQELESKNIKGFPMGLIRVASSAKEGEELAEQINKYYKENFGDQEIALAINSTDGKQIQSSYQQALRKLDETPLVLVFCNGMSMGVKIPSSVKPKITFIIEDRKVLAAMAQSFIGRLMGYRDENDPFPIRCHIYIFKEILYLLSKFNKDSASLNHNTIEGLPSIRQMLGQITMATHFDLNLSKKDNKTELTYGIIPEDIKSDKKVKSFFEDKYENSLRRATFPSFSFERYEDSTANDIQKIILEKGEKGGGNRLTLFYNPKVESQNPESEKKLKNAIESVNHELTKTILNELNITHQELLKAFNEGRLYRIKITYPNDNDEISIKSKNNAFCVQS